MNPPNSLDLLSQDQVLLKWQEAKDALAKAKDFELELRKYVVSRAFPEKQEGTNTVELGNDYKLKAVIKYNYKLAENATVESCLERVAKTGNEGAFIAERLISWTPNFLITEYRAIQEEVQKGNATAKQIYDIVNEMLTISEAAPTLNIVEPKAKK